VESPQNKINIRLEWRPSETSGLSPLHQVALEFPVEIRINQDSYTRGLWDIFCETFGFVEWNYVGGMLNPRFEETITSSNPPELL
jgi:hypothetical protein